MGKFNLMLYPYITFVFEDDLNFSAQAFGITYVLSDQVSGCDIARGVEVRTKSTLTTLAKT